MAGLADAFRMQWPPQPMMADPAMPVPQQPQAFDLNQLLQHPMFMQQEPPLSRMQPSPGFADFLRNYWLNQRGA
jgi:hypothetical protein